MKQLISQKKKKESVKKKGGFSDCMLSEWKYILWNVTVEDEVLITVEKIV